MYIIKEFCSFMNSFMNSFVHYFIIYLLSHLAVPYEYYLIQNVPCYFVYNNKGKFTI